MSDIEEFEEQINSLMDEIGDDEPTDEQVELLSELNEALEMAQDELADYEDDLGEGLDDNIEERRERLIGNDGVTLANGEIDTWERWTQDYQ